MDYFNGMIILTAWLILILKGLSVNKAPQFPLDLDPNQRTPWNLCHRNYDRPYRPCNRKPGSVPKQKGRNTICGSFLHIVRIWRCIQRGS